VEELQIQSWKVMQMLALSVTTPGMAGRRKMILKSLN